MKVGSETLLANTSAITGDKGTTEFISGYFENTEDIIQKAVKIAKNASLNNSGIVAASITNEGDLTSDASISMNWNIMDKAKFTANDASLPEVSVKPLFNTVCVSKNVGKTDLPHIVRQCSEMAAETVFHSGLVLTILSR